MRYFVAVKLIKVMYNCTFHIKGLIFKKFKIKATFTPAEWFA